MRGVEVQKSFILFYSDGATHDCNGWLWHRIRF
jgi:hypothetical protein